MTASLRLFARSRCLRVMGVLAWLMLVTTSLVAAPMGMQAQAAPSVHLATSVAGDHCHQDGAAMDVAASADCCGSQGMPGCYCAAVCANVVPGTLTMIAAAPVSTHYDLPPRIMAPSPNTAPPLRPPSI